MSFALPALIGGFAFLYLWHFWGSEAVIVAATRAGRAHLAEYGSPDRHRSILAIESEARAAARKEVREAIERIDHPCHDVCIGNLHADCQCAAWIRQEALDSLSTDTREENGTDDA